MNYYKNIEEGYIISMQETDAVMDGRISEEEYNRIISMLDSAPPAPEGYYTALKTDLTWDFLSLPPDPEVPPTPEEILSQLEAIL